MKLDTVQRVTVEHRSVVPRFGAGKRNRCYELEEAVVGGFTWNFARTAPTARSGPMDELPRMHSGLECAGRNARCRGTSSTTASGHRDRCEVG